MKFLIRRIRYAFAGHVMRGIFAIFGLLAVGVFVVVMLSGAVNQRALFEKIFGFAWNSSQNIADDVDQNGVPLDVSDQGIYFKDQAPEGAEVYDTHTDHSSAGDAQQSGENNDGSESSQTNGQDTNSGTNESGGSEK